MWKEIVLFFVLTVKIVERVIWFFVLGAVVDIDKMIYFCIQSFDSLINLFYGSGYLENSIPIFYI